MSAAVTAVAAGTALSAYGASQANQTASEAAGQKAAEQREAAAARYYALQQAGLQAQQLGAFKPVTVTSMFGTPNYTYDAYGRLTSATSTAAPWLQNVQTATQGMLPGFTTEAQRAAGDTRMLTAADKAYGVGNTYYNLAQQALPTSYDVADKTQEYYNRMQQMVAPEREQQLASTRNKLYQTGRQGIAVGATSPDAGGMLATNPEMAAYYNALAKQDLELANTAEQRARANLQQDISTGTNLYQQGTGMFGTSADLQNTQYKNWLAAQTPITGTLGNLQTYEGLQYAPVTAGFEYGKPVTAGAQYGADKIFQAANMGSEALMGGINKAADTMYAANASDPWANFMQQSGSSLASYGMSNLGSTDWSKLFGSSSSSTPQMTQAPSTWTQNTGWQGTYIPGVSKPAY